MTGIVYRAATSLTGKMAEVFIRKGPIEIEKQIAKNPKFFAELIAKLKASGFGAAAALQDKDFWKKIATSPVALFDWVRANPGQSIFITTALTSMGVNVMNLMKEEAAKPGSTVALSPQEYSVLSNIQREGDKAFVSARSAAGQALLDYASEDDDFETGLDNDQMARAVATIEVLRWAQSFFGNKEAAKRAHIMLQAFFEMPARDVETGFTIYNLQNR